MNLLALDLGAVTGWAYGPVSGDAMPVTGYWKMPKTGDDIGAYLQSARDHMQTMLSFIEAPCVIAFEQPIGARPAFNKEGDCTGINTNMATLRKLYGFAGLVEMMGLDAGHRMFETPVQSVKKALTGKGNAKKEQMVEAFIEHGMQWPEDLAYAERHNVADAFGVWILMAGKLAPKSAAERTPLFAKAG